MKTTLLILPAFFIGINIALGQIQINSGTGVTPEEMVEFIAGDGIAFSDVTYIGADSARGIFTQGQTTNLGLESGIFLTTGAGYIIPGPNQSSSAGVDNGIIYPWPPQWGQSYDPAILDFDFIPDSDTLRLKYVFGSEEYSEWAGSSFNDIFWMNISGPNPNGEVYVNKNIASIPGIPDTAVKINTVNNGYSPPGVVPTGPCMHCEFYKDNTGGLTLEYDGFTVVLTAWLPVIPCETYHAKFGVMDEGDGLYDTGIFIEENSFSSSAEIAVNTVLDPPGLTENLVEGHVEADLVFKLPSPEYAPITVCYEIGGTAGNGIDYEEIDNCITFEDGEDSVSYHIVPLYDGIIEGDETIELIIENTLGCVVKYDTVELIIEDYVEMVSQTSPNTMICPGQETELWIQVYHGFPPYQYFWEQGAFTDDTIVVSTATTTMYKVLYSDLFNETGEDSVLVNVLPLCELETFYFEAILNPGLPYDIYGVIINDTVFVVFPAGTNLTALIPSFTFEDAFCPDTVGTINDFTSPVVYEFVGPGGCTSEWIVIADIETGITKNPNEGYLIYPNPSSGIIYVRNAGRNTDPVEISISDLVGRVIFYRSEKIEERMEINLTDKTKGIYLVHLNTGRNNIVKKLIL